MTVLYLLAFLLFCAGILLLFGLTPEHITADLLRLLAPEPTLRDKIRTARGEKTSRRLTAPLLHLQDALAAAGLENRFALTCGASLILLLLGCIPALLLENVFLLPVLAVGCASLPFFFSQSTLAAYDRRMQEEMETALSVISTAYIRSEDLVQAVEENLPYLRPPVRDVFRTFAVDASLLSSDTKAAIRRMKEKIHNDIFEEWCDTLLACQDDRTLRDTLLPLAARLTDARLVNGELQSVLAEAAKEYRTMACLLPGNLPLLYALNRDWFDTLVYSLPGKAVLAICGAVLLVTAIRMQHLTRPVAYRR